MREKNSDIFEEIARNTRNISKSLYVLALLNYMNYNATDEYQPINVKGGEGDNLMNISKLLYSMKEKI